MLIEILFVVFCNISKNVKNNVSNLTLNSYLVQKSQFRKFIMVVLYLSQLRLVELFTITVLNKNVNTFLSF